MELCLVCSVILTILATGFGANNYNGGNSGSYNGGNMGQYYGGNSGQYSGGNSGQYSGGNSGQYNGGNMGQYYGGNSGQYSGGNSGQYSGGNSGQYSRYSEPWNTLSITWCSDPNENPSCFQEMPMTTKEAVERGWYKISKDCFNNGRYDGFIYIYRGDYSVSLIYNVYGNIVGIQTNMLAKELTSCHSYDFHYDYGHVPYFLVNKFKGHQYFTLTAYFVDPKSICFDYNIPYTRGYRTELGKGIWLQSGDTSLVTEFIPPYRQMAVKKYWDIAQCVDSMGFHNFRNMRKWSRDNCATIAPWAPLYDQYGNGRNNVLAFMVFANATSQNNRYEHLPSATVQTVMNGDDCPKCAKPLMDQCGFTTMHVYFRRNPQSFKCPAKETQQYY